MRVWLRRLAILLFVLSWLILMILPFTAFMLAARGEILLGSNPGSHARLFLLQGSDEQGVGLEWSRADRENAGCFQSSVNYFMWEGEAVNTAFCQCFDLDSGEALPASSATCGKPR